MEVDAVRHAANWTKDDYFGYLCNRRRPHYDIPLRMNKIAVLYDAGQAVLSTFDLDEVLQRILAIAHDYFHLRNVAILLLDRP
jgi:hypothetical protein